MHCAPLTSSHLVFLCAHAAATPKRMPDNYVTISDLSGRPGVPSGVGARPVIFHSSCGCRATARLLPNAPLTLDIVLAPIRAAAPIERPLLGAIKKADLMLHLRQAPRLARIQAARHSARAPKLANGTMRSLAHACGLAATWSAKTASTCPKPSFYFARWARVGAWTAPTLVA